MSPLEHLAAAEHALLVDCLTACCVLGHDQDPSLGGPEPGPAADAAAWYYNSARDHMFHFADANRQLVEAGRDPVLSRPPGTVDATPEAMLTRQAAAAAAVDAEHATAFQELRALLTPVPPGLFRATRRRTDDPVERALLATSDACYRATLAVLDARFRAPDADDTFDLRQLAQRTMAALDDADRALVRRRLVPAFTP